MGIYFFGKVISEIMNLLLLPEWANPSLPLKWHRRWMWVWVNCGSWWWTGRPGVLRFMGSQRVRHDWTTELTELSDTKSKLVLLTAWQANKLKDKLRQGIMALFGKPEDQGNDGLLFKRTIFLDLEFRLCFYYKWRGMIGCCKLLSAV